MARFDYNHLSCDERRLSCRTEPPYVIPLEGAGGASRAKSTTISSFVNPQIARTTLSASFDQAIMPDARTHVVLRPIKNVVSSSWLYPFKGIWYFCAHREYWPLWGRRLIPLTVTSIVILGILFTFTYLPQVAFLALFHGHLAWFNAVFLVLGEAQIVIALLFEALLVDETLVNVFDVCSLAIADSAKLTHPGNTD